MAAHKICKDHWPYDLTPQLTGKAQLAFAAMSSTEAKDYDAIKVAILTRYGGNEEAYHRQFCSAIRQHDKTYQELSICLVDLQNKWLWDYTSVEEMAKLFVSNILMKHYKWTWRPGYETRNLKSAKK